MTSWSPPDRPEGYPNAWGLGFLGMSSPLLPMLPPLLLWGSARCFHATTPYLLLPPVFVPNSSLFKGTRQGEKSKWLTSLSNNLEVWKPLPGVWQLILCSLHWYLCIPHVFVPCLSHCSRHLFPISPTIYRSSCVLVFFGRCLFARPLICPVFICLFVCLSTVKS